MALLDNIRFALGSAWHVGQEKFYAALLPAVDGTAEANKVLTADASQNVTLTGTVTAAAFSGGTNKPGIVSQVAQSANGLLGSTPIKLADFKNADGSALAAAAAAGKFGQSITLGTSAFLVSESANNNTKTDDAIFEYVLPAWYKAGQNITVTTNCSITGAGTLSTKTVQVKAYRAANDGTEGANLGPAAQAMTAAGADVAHTITGTTLNPGDKVTFELETVLTETASSGMVANINSVRIS